MYITFKIKDKEIGIDLTIVKRILFVIIGIILLLNFKLITTGCTNLVRLAGGSAKKYELAVEQFKVGLENEQSQIVVNGISSQGIASRIGHEFLGGNPEYFYVKGISYRETGENEYTYYITYMAKGETLKIYKEDYNLRINEIVSQMNKDTSDYEKAVQIHDYIADNFTYDFSYDIHDPYTMLLKNKGVCSAYAQLYKSLCNKMGLECEIVWTSFDNHAWNVIKINGLWYHVDVTWDDTGEGEKEYFLMPDNAIWGSGHHQWTNCGAYKIVCFSYKYRFK